MKLIYLILLWTSIMAQQLTPYPYPEHSEDLMAKELINGTYIASINMMMRNTQSGEERYSYVPDSPIIEKMEQGTQVTEVKEQGLDSDTAVYDRDKSLEDAVLPKYVDVDDNSPLIVSSAMCPQNIVYYGEYDALTSNRLQLFNNGENAYAVALETTNANGETTVNGDYETLWKLDGLSKTKLFTKKNDEIDFIYSVGSRNFFRGQGKIFEYDGSEITEVLDYSFGSTQDFILKENNNYYIVYSDGSTLFCQNIDTGEISQLEVDGVSSVFEPMMYKTNYFKTIGQYFKIENGKIVKMENLKKWKKATAISRFDYLNNSFESGYNISRGNYELPKTKRPYNTAKINGMREGYISFSNKSLWYTRDYKTYINTGIVANDSGVTEIVVTVDYLYISDGRKIVVAQIDDWKYVVPDSRFVSVFAINGLLNNRQIYIGY